MWELLKLSKNCPKMWPRDIVRDSHSHSRCSTVSLPLKHLLHKGFNPQGPGGAANPQGLGGPANPHQEKYYSYMKAKMNHLKENRKNKNICEKYEFQWIQEELWNSYLCDKNFNGIIVADTTSIIIKREQFYYNLWNGHQSSSIEGGEIYTAGSYIPDPSISEEELAMDKWKYRNAPGID